MTDTSSKWKENYYVDTDPDDVEEEGFFSIFHESVEGHSYEVAGKIGSKLNADLIATFLNGELAK